MNDRLRLSPSIEKNPDVIPAQQLTDYLRRQTAVKPIERLVQSFIQLCLDSEKSKAIIDYLFPEMPFVDFEKANAALSSLETWDRVILHGGRTLTGDVLRLKAGTFSLNFKDFPSGTQCRVEWTRSMLFGLLKTLIKRPLGKLIIGHQIKTIRPTDQLKFHSAGEPEPNEIQMRQIECIIRG